MPFVALKFMSRARDGASGEMRRMYYALVMHGGVGVDRCPRRSRRRSRYGSRRVFGDGLTPYRVSALIIALLGVPPIALAPCSAT